MRKNLNKLMYLPLSFCLLFLSGCTVIDYVSNAFVGMIVGFFALIGVWYVFWPVMIAGFFTIGWLTSDIDNDHPIMGFLSLLIYLVIIRYSGNFDFITHIKSAPTLFAIFAALYLVGGFVHTSVRSHSEGRKLRVNYLKTRDDLMKKHNLHGMDAWLTYLSNNPDKDIVKPENKISKTKLFVWFIFWPYCAVWFLLKDIIIETLKKIHRYLSNFYNALFQKGAGEAFTDFEAAEALRNKVTENKSEQLTTEN